MIEAEVEGGGKPELGLGLCMQTHSFQGQRLKVVNRVPARPRRRQDRRPERRNYSLHHGTGFVTCGDWLVGAD